MKNNRLALSLLIIRVSAAAFLGVWASLKFFRPEWMVNVFRGSYGLEFVTQDYAYFVGSLQMFIVVLFLIGFQRTIFYGFTALMHSAGVIVSIPTLLFKFTNYPANLLWTSVPTLGALVALFLLREHDNWTVDGLRGRKKVKNDARQ